jgi:adenylylsulfate kinase-like enzyme
MIILFFGQPASGKTTLADSFLNDKNISEFFWSFVRIDGDKWRDITKNKDYSKEGRVRNLKGAFDMALYLEKDDYIPVLSFVTPYQELRDYLRENSSQLVEIYLEYNEDRGRNDRFAKDFENPDENVLRLNTSEKSIEECLVDIKHFFNQKQNK